MPAPSILNLVILRQPARPAALLAALLLFLLTACTPVDSESSASFTGQDFLLGMHLEELPLSDPELDLAELTQQLEGLASRGFNALHLTLLDMPHSAVEWDQANPVQLNPVLVQNTRRILDLAQANDMRVVLGLFSWRAFEPAVQAASETASSQGPAETLVAAQRLQQLFASYRSILDLQNTVLLPLVTALARHPAVFAWELFDSPEWVADTEGWTAVRVPVYDLQLFISASAAAIHRVEPSARVGIANASLRYLAGVPGSQDYASREALFAAGQDSQGYLNYLSVHYNPGYMGEGLSPFSRPAADWGSGLAMLLSGIPAETLDDKRLTQLQELGYRAVFLYRQFLGQI